MDCLKSPLAPGCRVRVNANAVRSSLPKDAWCGQHSMEGVRLGRTFDSILDATDFRPFVTEVRPDAVEIATSYYGDGMRTLRIPHRAVLAVTMPAPQMERQR